MRGRSQIFEKLSKFMTKRYIVKILFWRASDSEIALSAGSEYIRDAARGIYTLVLVDDPSPPVLLDCDSGNQTWSI